MRNIWKPRVELSILIHILNEFLILSIWYSNTTNSVYSRIGTALMKEILFTEEEETKWRQLRIAVFILFSYVQRKVLINKIAAHVVHSPNENLRIGPDMCILTLNLVHLEYSQISLIDYHFSKTIKQTITESIPCYFENEYKMLHLIKKRGNEFPLDCSIETISQ